MSGCNSKNFDVLASLFAGFDFICELYCVDTHFIPNTKSTLFIVAPYLTLLISYCIIVTLMSQELCLLWPVISTVTAAGELCAALTFRIVEIESFWDKESIILCKLKSIAGWAVKALKTVKCLTFCIRIMDLDKIIKIGAIISYREDMDMLMRRKLLRDPLEISTKRQKENKCRERYRVLISPWDRIWGEQRVQR